MKEQQRKAIEEEAMMEMTPMIDVVFLLIIFFLCIDFKILEAKIPAYLPKDVGSNTTDVEPQEKLNIRIVCEHWGTEIPRRQLTAEEVKAGKKSAFRLDGHDVRYEVGPKKYRGTENLLEELSRIAKDPSKKQKDPKTGELKLMSVVIEPGPSVTYGDVATTLDAVREAGFEEISFGGGQGSRKGS